ncbi:MAG: 3-phosphoshikimate 1-carboxyvinyltransferase [Lachnospiraceae bacterium]|nr:3-phosphoshikimate 1-carboxyvinyltransferase [Lachnospiraceae bacterium]
MKLYHASSLHGTMTVPGDKSISHRSVILGAIAEGDTRIRGFLKSDDCLSTIKIFRAMGVSIEEKEDELVVHGAGLHGLKAPINSLDCGNSGTTARLLSGLLSGQSFSSALTGDASLSRRPMKRVIDPLRILGADIRSETEKGTLPLHISPSGLTGKSITIPVSSAQVKSALLLAGLYAEGETRVTEPALSRNHTELMLKAFGADAFSGSFKEPTAVIRPGDTLHGQDITVPGDISSAAFFLGAGLITPDSEITVKNVGINPTRDGLLRVLKDMNANLTIENEKEEGGEKCADLTVRTSSLKAAQIGGSLIPLLIDELPLIALLATQAEGRTVIRDAGELKVKESDRILLMSEGLNAMGAKITPTGDGMVIEGPTPLHHARIETGGDHRIAMTFSVASLINSDVQCVTLSDSSCVSISYPTFYRDLDALISC